MPFSTPTCCSRDHRSTPSSYDGRGHLFGRQRGKRPEKPTTSLRPKRRRQLGPAHLGRVVDHPFAVHHPRHAMVRRNPLLRRDLDARRPHRRARTLHTSGLTSNFSDLSLLTPRLHIPSSPRWFGFDTAHTLHVSS